ncbi:MAG: sulfite exporter TauE/SafE family protein [Acidobacteria bacterium]|nr:sulfite exporter TauE/SafE family protein [Acidobacteriota bacterium]
MPPSILIFLVVLGLFSGAFGALVGLGGSIILVPVIILLMGDFLPLQSAIAAGLVCVIATSSAATEVYLRRDWVDVRLGMLLELGTVIGAIGGALLVTWIPATWLKALFGFFLLAAAVLLFRRTPTEAEEVAEAVPAYQVRNYPLGVAGCYLAGSVSGLLGIGGGPIQVPLMYLGMGVPLKIAAATSNSIMGVTAAAGALLYYLRGDVIVVLTAPLVLGVLIGAQLSSRLARRVRSRVVQLLLILVLLALAALMFAEATGIALPWRSGR